MVANYYGCTGGHVEFTCLSAYYHNKKFKKYAAWCESCRERYAFPDPGGK